MKSFLERHHKLLPHYLMLFATAEILAYVVHNGGL